MLFKCKLIPNKVFGFIKNIIIIFFLNTFYGETVFPGLNNHFVAFIDFFAFRDFLSFSDFL